LTLVLPSTGEPPDGVGAVTHGSEERMGIRLGLNIVKTRIDEAAYPESLLDLRDPPEQLYSIGALGMLPGPCVAIVGTRDATGYGMRMARSIARAFANSGVTVVSGMARGIDAAAHYAVLDAGGRTIAVLGTGVDIAYPAGHRELHRTIGQRGLLLSENAPGAAAFRGAFPKRNRIIGALASVTIVVEAGVKSGAINTANQAMDIGRTVAAVPGPVDSPQSMGTNQLLRDGASMISCIADALALAGVSTAAPPPPLHLSERDASVWKAIGGAAVNVNALAVSSGLDARDCLAAITSLELAGLVECLVTGEVRRR